MQDGQPFTDFEVFSAFVWAHVAKAKNLLASLLGYPQAVKMFFPVDVRNRLSPPVSKDYLGTATLQVVVEMPLHELLEICNEDDAKGHMALANVAAAIRNTDHSVNDAFVRRRLRLARALKNTRRMKYNAHSRDNDAFFYENMVSSGMGLGGRWGIPAGNAWGPEVVRVIQPITRVGSCQILPAPGQGRNGLVEAQICLYSDEMLRLLEDAVWMKQVDSVLDTPEDWTKQKK